MPDALPRQKNTLAVPIPASAPLLPAPVRWLLMGLAVLSLGLGILGLFLPLLPTVPFVLLAAWAASLSSPRLSRWLESHPRLGPYIIDWRRGGVVRRQAKWMASVTMSISAIASLVLLHGHWAAWVATATMAGMLAWLWRRREQAAQADSR